MYYIFHKVEILYFYKKNTTNFPAWLACIYPAIYL